MNKTKKVAKRLQTRNKSLTENIFLAFGKGHFKGTGSAQTLSAAVPLASFSLRDIFQDEWKKGGGGRGGGT